MNKMGEKMSPCSTPRSMLKSSDIVLLSLACDAYDTCCYNKDGLNDAPNSYTDLNICDSAVKEELRPETCLILGE